MQEQRNLVLAIVLSVIVLFGFQYLMPKRAANPPQTAGVSAPASQAPNSHAADDRAASSLPAPELAASPAARATRTEVLADAPRIPIDTPRLHGSLSLAGARIDDLVLNDYYEKIGHDKKVTLLSPAGSPDAYYVEFGWTGDAAAPLPNASTVWSGADGQRLTPETPVTLTWDNGAGLVFTRTIAVDTEYMFTVTQTVANHGAVAVALKPVGEIVRIDPPKVKASYGPSPSVAGYYGEGLDEVSYDDLAKGEPVTHQLTGGWAGFNDKYWLVTAAPPANMPAAITLRDDKAAESNRYSVAYQGEALSIAPGATVEARSLVFAGAKVQQLLAGYEDSAGLPKLERTIDFGWLYILAEPFFIALDFIFRQVGNFGVAILLFNVLLKIILFPLQDRSFHQMARMKDVQPKIAALKERFGDDREKMAAAQMELFKKEKINPASGCLPVFVQIPIFYSLYRVLSTSIEMRQAPFFGWIHDLSAPDPTNLFNLFGLIPIELPQFLTLGAWPLIYGATMFLQQKMTPTPTTDPTQARIMMLMPLMFMFFFAQAPAGLTVYYSWNAVLTIAQMALIRHRSNKRQALAAAQKEKA
jgi:YidC/Oxa1 family membrane protein insertase